jgi:ribosomal-protein-alanine N-acetyltransferase
MIAMDGPDTLTTARLLLRPFRPGDVDDALLYRNDEEFAHFLPHIPLPFTRRDAEAFVALNRSESWQRFRTFAVVLQGRVIGTVNLEIDPETRSAMIGYALGRLWWSQGLATEAALAVLTWGFEVLALVRIWASTDSRHVRSQRVLEKLGMQREAIRVGHHVGRDGLLADEVVYGISRSDWFMRQGLDA